MKQGMIKIAKVSLVFIICVVGCSDIDYPTDVLDNNPFDMSGGTIVIDDDAEYAYSQQVSIACNVVNAVTMQFSRDASTWSSLEAFNPTKQWVLPLQYGQQTIYGQFFNSRGGSIVYQDSIFYIERLLYQPATYLGGDVAISDDGTVVAAGSYEGNANAVYVFRKKDIDWECTVLQPGDVQAGDKFGFSVALSGDGRWLFAGAPVKKAVYVFEYNDGWQLRQEITSSRASFGYDVTTDASGSYLGIVSYDGKDIRIYYDKNANGQYQSNNAVTYVQIKPYSIVISKDGKYLCSGMCDSDNKGIVRIFPVPYFTSGYSINPDDNQVYADFGRSISVTDDAGLCVVGAPGYDIASDDDKGCLYVYQKSGNAYTLLAQVKNTEGANGDALGKAVAISPNGQYIGAAIPLSDDGGVDRGKVLVYKLNGTTLEYVTTYTADDRDNKCYYGNSLAISNNGVVAIGAPFTYVSTVNDNGGVVYIRRLE
ncbi:MAG: hypothetical protein AB1444_13630 [Spirochaetota bacterium]